jgi:hypothetical protein
MVGPTHALAAARRIEVRIDNIRGIRFPRRDGWPPVTGTATAGHRSTRAQVAAVVIFLGGHLKTGH